MIPWQFCYLLTPVPRGGPLVSGGLSWFPMSSDFLITPKGAPCKVSAHFRPRAVWLRIPLSIWT